MNNARFAISLHILTLMAYQEDQCLSSEFIAGSINVNPVVVRKEIGNLRDKGLIESKAGRYGGSTLAKPAEQIHISDIYNAVHPTPALGLMRDKPNPKCPVGKQINEHLLQLQNDTEHAILTELNGRTLADFCQNFR